MASHNTTLASQEVLGGYEALSSLAVAILNEHVNAAGLYAVCGCGWPCERVVLAEHNYDLAAS
jgi:hypothetical protein